MNSNLKSIITLIACCTLGAATASAAIYNGFTGPFASSEWTITEGGDASIVITTGTMTLTASDATGSVAQALWAFDETWDFTSAEVSFDYLIQVPPGQEGSWFIWPMQTQVGTGIPTTLTYPSGSGTINIPAYNPGAPGENNFRFLLNPMELNFAGSATVTISNFVFDTGGAIPEPASLAILGLGGLMMLRRRRRA